MYSVTTKSVLIVKIHNNSLQLYTATGLGPGGEGVGRCKWGQVSTPIKSPNRTQKSIETKYRSIEAYAKKEIATVDIMQNLFLGIMHNLFPGSIKSFTHDVQHIALCCLTVFIDFQGVISQSLSLFSSSIQGCTLHQ